MHPVGSSGLQPLTIVTSVLVLAVGLALAYLTRRALTRILNSSGVDSRLARSFALLPAASIAFWSAFQALVTLIHALPWVYFKLAPLLHAVEDTAPLVIQLVMWSVAIGVLTPLLRRSRTPSNSQAASEEAP